MNIVISFITNLQASKVMQPGNRALDDPARFAQTATVRCADTGEFWHDALLAQCLPVLIGTVPSVALNDAGFAQWSASFAANRRNGRDQRIQLLDVVTVRAAQDDCERNALRLDNKVMLAAELAPVRGVRTSFFPADTARIEELSTMARSRSSWPRRRNSASNASWMRCQTPAFCHASSRRQHTLPEPQPSSCGSRFHAVPERRTKMMPLSTARSAIGLRPAWRRLREGRTGNSGSMNDHSSSSISSLVIASCMSKQSRKLPTHKKS